jgi:hypothetical protein
MGVSRGFRLWISIHTHALSEKLPVDPVTNFGIVQYKLMGEFLGQLEIKITPSNSKNVW